jgi:hypothetical protein
MSCEACRRELLDELKSYSRSEALDYVRGLSDDLTQFEYLASRFPFPACLSRVNWG